MATLQSTLPLEGMQNVTLRTWHSFISSLRFADIGAFAGQTSAAFARMWSIFTPADCSIAKATLEYLIDQHGKELGDYVQEMANLTGLPGLEQTQSALERLQGHQSFDKRLLGILRRIDIENESVALQGLQDLKRLIGTKPATFRSLTSGDTFNAPVGLMMKTIVSAAVRTGDSWNDVRLAAFECIGIIGALDPDRFELPSDEVNFVVLQNFRDTSETHAFAMFLITHVLIRAYQSSNDTKHQAALAYALQELLKVCGFTQAILQKSGSISPQVQQRWNALPKPVIEAIAPLLSSRFSVKLTQNGSDVHPIYATSTTYTDWIRAWALDLVYRVSGSQAAQIFGPFNSVIKHGDAGVTLRLVPPLVLNILISGKSDAVKYVQDEILAVLQDQVTPVSTMTPDARLLCAQVRLSPDTCLT